MVLSFFICTVTFAQDEVVIRGRVLDKTEGVSVIGANVIEYDKENRVVNGTVCDVNGDFQLKMKDPSNVVKVVMIGYNTKTIPSTTASNITIELVPITRQVGEVVVTARKREELSLTNIEERDVASARVKVDMEEMRETGALSAADALQGKVAGLDIIAASGDPGSGSQLVIRGISGMGNNQPLVVIDGIRQQPINEYNGGDQFDLSSADQEDISNLLNIALQDIKSIEVLKDAASTAVYGAEGADGVLVIETYKGKLGKVKFDYSYKGSLLFQPKSIPMLNGDEYVMLQLEEWHNKDGVFDVPPEIAYDRDYVDFYNYSQNTDWLEAITRTGRTHDHYFNLSGGGDKTRYFTSFSYIDEKGTTLNTDAKTFITRINLDYFLSKKTLFSVQFSYMNERVGNNVRISNGAGGTRNVREMAYMKAPNMSIYRYDAAGNMTNEFFNPINSYQGSGGVYFNPVAIARLSKDDRRANRLTNNFTLQYNVNRWINFRETLSFQFGGSKSFTYLPYSALGTDWLEWTVNKAEESNNINTSINTETQLSFNSPFSDSSNHSISGSLAWITNQAKYEWMNLQSRNLPSVIIQDPAAGGRINWIGDGSGESRNIGALVNLNYKYKDRYLVQGIFRADAYSLFGANNRWGYFKGASVGWRFSDEPILNNLNFLGESMFRVSWGVSGKPPETGFGLPDVTYARFATYESGNYNYGRHTGVVNTQIALDNLKWQSVTQTDIGLELNLFNDRLYLEGDIYRKKTEDMIFAPYYISSSSGFENVPYFNGGELENKGWEFMMVYNMIRKKDFKVSINFNSSHNENAFKRFPDNFNKEKDVTIDDGKYPLRVEEGQPVGSFFGFRYLGVYSTDEDAYARDANDNLLLDSDGNAIPMTYKDYIFRGGDAKYADLNHDGKIDLNDVEYIGDSNPDFVGGFGASVKYKNISMLCGFHYRVGFDIVNRNAINTQGMNNKNNQSKRVLNRWRVEGQNYKDMLPRAYMDHEANNLGSDRYVEKGDYLRLLNLMFTYQFSNEFCQKLNLNALDISLSARKLFTLTNYTGEDPEIGQNASDPFWIGEDQSNTPPPRMYTLSISVGF